jgi:hypothetical protein
MRVFRDGAMAEKFWRQWREVNPEPLQAHLPTMPQFIAEFTD